MATICISLERFASYRARRILRPMRPYPLMPTLIAISSLPLFSMLELCCLSGSRRECLVDRLLHMLGGEAELLEHILGRGRRAEMIDAHDLTPEPHVFPPRLGRRRLDGDPPHDLRGEHVVLVCPIMLSEVARPRPR